MDIKKLQERVKEVTDSRRPWGNLRHKLEDILMIGLCSVICKGEYFEDMELFGKEREKWLKKFLELPYGIPASMIKQILERTRILRRIAFILDHIFSIELKSGL